MRNAHVHLKSFVLTAVVVCLLAAVVAPPAQALPAPSKTGLDQSLAERQNDLASLQGVLDNEQVVAVLAEHGLSRDEANLRLAQLAPEQLSSLADQVEQIQAAGQWAPYWIWILVGVLIVVAIIAIV